MRPDTLLAIILSTGLSTIIASLVVRPRPTFGRGILAWIAGVMAILAVAYVFDMPGIVVPAPISLVAFSSASGIMSGIGAATKKMVAWSVIWTIVHIAILTIVPILLR